MKNDFGEDMNIAIQVSGFIDEHKKMLKLFPKTSGIFRSCKPCRLCWLGHFSAINENDDFRIQKSSPCTLHSPVAGEGFTNSDCLNGKIKYLK